MKTNENNTEKNFNQKGGFPTTDNNLKEKYKNLSPSDLASYGILTPAKTSGYICPFCGNGSGDDGTGIDMKLLNSGYEGHCFKCGENFDVFKIIAHDNNLNANFDFHQIMEIAKNKFGDAPISKQTPQPAQKPKTNFSENLKKWNNNLKDFVKNQGGTFRGLIYEQLQKFYCGYEPNFPSYVSDEDGNSQKIFAPRFIIPSCRTHYLARLLPCDLQISDELKKNLEKKSKQHFGTKTLFGKKFLPNDAKFIFVTEGEFDSMSIDQCGFPSISISGSKLSGNMISEFKEFSTDKIFIILLDNDETGRNLGKENAKILDKLGFKVTVAQLDENFKDANEFLQADSDGLTENLKNILADVEENQKYFSAENNEEKTGFTTKEIIKNCPIDLDIPAGFNFSAKGIFKVYTDKSGNEKSVKVSDTPIVITRIIETSEQTNGQVEISIFNKKNNLWHKHIISRTDAADNRAMTKLAAYGVSITSGRAKFMAEYLNDLQFTSTNLLKIPATAVYDQPGWTNNTCEKFIHPAGDGDIYIVDNNGFNYKKAFSVKGDKNIWLEKIFKRLFKISFAFRTFFGFTLSAFLTLPCSVRNFQMSLHAPSGSGKSAIAKACMTFQGDPETIRRTFNSTGNSVDEWGPVFNDCCAWIDEFQSAPKKVKENIQQTIYNFAEGKTRGRLDKNALQKVIKNFRGMRIYTAEQPILPYCAGQGALARLIEISCKKVLPNDIAVDIHELANHHYGHFFKDWINYIVKNKTEIKENYIWLRDYYTDVGEKKGSPFLAAHVQAIAISHIALIHFCKMLGIAEELEVADMLTTDFDNQLSDEIMATIEDTKNITRAFNYLKEILETHQQRFIEENPAAKNYPQEDYSKFNVPTVAPAIGIKFCKKVEEVSNKWAKGGDVAFFPMQLRQLLTEAGFPSADAIIKGFYDEGFLSTSNNDKRRYQKGIRLGDKTMWVYYFPAEVLDDSEEDNLPF